MKVYFAGIDWDLDCFYKLMKEKEEDKNSLRKMIEIMILYLL